jgi:hypothetical protein
VIDLAVESGVTLKFLNFTSMLEVDQEGLLKASTGEIELQYIFSKFFNTELQACQYEAFPHRTNIAAT